VKSNLLTTGHWPLTTRHDPKHALTDGAQSIPLKTLKDLMPTLRKIALAVDREI
jgi:3-deoxy-D-manno-octulosonic acid (KDO) 8-phosphate synthase